ncbi:hypothetical protein K1719_008672 [Acacia pycnantha]|nr:hypothetical protein K1719_008672 [Acacia pycnantha]
MCPRSIFEEKEKERLMRPFRRTLVVKLLGQQPSYGFMVKKLRQIWARKGNIDIMDLDNDFYLAIRLDIHTAQRARGKFARMCVELDLTKPLVPEFSVEGQVLSMVYKSLGLLCKNCGRFGYNKEGCEAFTKKQTEEGDNGLNKNPKKRRGLGESNNGVGRSRGRSLRRVVHKGKLEKEDRRGNVLVEVDKCSYVRASNDSQHVYRSYEVVPETNLDKYEGRKVNTNGKENLLNRKGGVMEGRDLVDFPKFVEDDDPIESLNTCMEEEGAASKRVAFVLQDMHFRYKLNRVIILELRISGAQASKVVGQVIHCNLRLGEEELLFSAIYASPTEHRRHNLWDLLSGLPSDINVSWLLVGDFNDIKTSLEQAGGERVYETRCRYFNNWIQDCNLIDVRAEGPFYTWKGPKWDGLERVYKRLEKCL